MWDILGNGLNRITDRFINLIPEDLDQLHKSIPDDVGIYKLRGIRGYSMEDVVSEAVYKYSNFCEAIEYGSQQGRIKTIIFVLPYFCFKDYTDTNSTHLNGYRGLGKDRIIYNKDPYILGDSLSLVHEFSSGKNAWTVPEIVPTTMEHGSVINNSVQVVKEKSYILGQVFKATDKFHERLGEYCGEQHKTLVENIFFVTSAYCDENDISSFKSLHIIMKGIYTALGKRINTPLQKWIENYRRNGAKDYVNTIISAQQAQRDELTEQLNRLRSQMDSYFKKLTPIELLLADEEGILSRVNQALIDCEKIKGVKSAYLDREGSFHMVTDHIYIKQPTTTVVQPGEENTIPQNLYWDIGRLHITTKKTGKVYIISNTRQVLGVGGRLVGHPHVIDSNGEACLGDIKLIVLDLINQHDYATLAGILITFARSVNLDDVAGKTVTSWPTVQLNPS